MPPLENSEADLLLQPIPHPTGITWFNGVQKVGRDNCEAYLQNMATLVGMCPDVFSNKSGCATLITGMAACGVPDEVGMLMSGHHTTYGYLRYDRSQAVKMEAAALVASNPAYTYQSALAKVSKKFIEDKVFGDTTNYKPLVALGMSYSSVSNLLQAASSNEVTSATSSEMVLSKSTGLKALTERVTRKAMAISMCHEVQANANPVKQITLCGIEGQVIVGNTEHHLKAWHGDYDQIDWEVEMKNNPVLHKALGGLGGSGGRSQVSVGSRIGSSLAGNSFHLGSHCVIKFICGKSDDDKENDPRKENVD